jgi:hypothetical protein
MKPFFFTLSLTILSFSVFSQSNITLSFNNGFFLNFDQILKNTPISTEQIISSLNHENPFFLKKVFEQDSIHYLDENANEITVSTNDIWGYAFNNVLYINYQNQFNRIAQLGKISIFLAKVTVTKTYDTMNNYDGSLYLPESRSTTTTELQRYIIDFSNGQIYPFSTESVKLLLSSDSDLYTKYMQLSKRKRKKMIFLYIREFNKKHPLIIPK